MKTITTFCRLADMRRRAGASPITSITWAAGLLWRNHRASHRQHL